jgi:hypothetical protein
MKNAEQLELEIGEARATMSPAEVLDYVIKLYGAEFEKANAEIKRLRDENLELFQLKQKVQIVNRELMHALEGRKDAKAPKLHNQHRS